MSLRSILLIVAALLMAGGTVLVGRSWIESQRGPVAEQPATPKTPKAPFVLVAARDLPLGSFLKQGDFRWQPWPDDNLPESYLRKSEIKEADHYGSVVRRSFSAGEPITQDRLIKPGDRGFLAAVLQAGYRAVAIPVGATSSVAGLIFPGDRVDILLTQTLRVKEAGEAGEKEGGEMGGGTEMRATETVLTNVRILALDQKIDDQTNKPKLAKTATLEVTPKQAEMLAVARELGSLSLSLRSLAKDEEELRRIVESEALPEEADPEKGTTYTWDSEASLLVNRNSGRGGDVETVTVARGKEVQQLKFRTAQ